MEVGLTGTADHSVSHLQWLNSAGTAFRNLCLAFHHLKLPFHHLKLSFHHLAMPFDAVLYFWSVFFGKIITIVATRGQIFRLKCSKYYFGWGSAPDPTGGAYSAPPDLLAGFKGPTSKGREERGRKGKGAEDM